MKNYILITLLVGLVSFSYAGSSCGDKSSDSCDKDNGPQEFTQTSTLLAKSCGSCGGCSGDKTDKTDKSGKSGFNAQKVTQTSTLLAKSCGSCGGCSGDKTDKTDKSGKSGLEVISLQFAGSSCDDDDDSKKCGSKSLISA